MNADISAPSWTEHCFIGCKERLQPDNAVAAILVLEDGRYVMQLRDTIPNIFYPGHWGCFGGAVEVGESPQNAIWRELAEELEYVPDVCNEFTRFDFDFSRVGLSKVYRIYFEIDISLDAFNGLVLHEGAAFEAVSGKELLMERRVTPYDAFAIWTHMHSLQFTQSWKDAT